MSRQPSEKQVQIQIGIDEATAQGIYSNLAFLYIQPKARLRARVITSHTKRVLKGEAG